MPVAVVPMQFFAPAWIVIVKLSLSHRYKHSGCPCYSHWPFSPFGFRGSDHGETPWVTWGAFLGLQWEEFGGWQGGLNWGGCCSWLSRGDTNSRLIYRGIYMDLPIWSGEAIGLPPIHDMDVRKWLFGVIWSWKRSELRLVHDPTSLTHF